ncbi:RHBD3 protein, partial [Polyodon spathula]|nr:RHBD3 protein [Polyodon spathula]
MLSGRRDQLPLTSTDRRPQLSPDPSLALPPPAPAPFNRPHWPVYHTPPAHLGSASFEWAAEGALAASESLLLEEELLRAGILASLQESPGESPDKLEVPKSSVSSLRLQQLEQMGFPTEKAVVALAASGKLEGAISLLIDNRVGEEAVVTTRGKALPSQRPA